MRLMNLFAELGWVWWNLAGTSLYQFESSMPNGHLVLLPVALCDHLMKLLVFYQVQSFLRGWLCRRKWKTIIQDYIRSPHADSMRKRNQVVFSMLEAEAEYVQQLHILVNNFLRPLRMAASSKKPPITHDDVSSIFLNRWVGATSGYIWLKESNLIFQGLKQKQQQKLIAPQLFILLVCVRFISCLSTFQKVCLVAYNQI